MKASEVIEELKKNSSPKDAAFLQRFFKTGEGQYGAGDQFIGVRMPQLRAVCKHFKMLPLSEIQKLFNSKTHEHRMAAGVICDYQYPKADTVGKKAIYHLYLENVFAGNINNWDIVDVTCRDVIGRYLQEFGLSHDVLLELARSDNLWQKRVGIISTFYFFKSDNFSTTLEICEILLHDKHDLIQKAVGWSLREVGKRAGREVLVRFLDTHAAAMPRVTLRYAIEHFSSDLKQHYLGLRELSKKGVHEKK